VRSASTLTHHTIPQRIAPATVELGKDALPALGRRLRSAEFVLVAKTGTSWGLVGLLDWNVLALNRRVFRIAH
jgi:hypothetical protein